MEGTWYKVPAVCQQHAHIEARITHVYTRPSMHMRALEPLVLPICPRNDERASRRKTAQISRVNEALRDASGPPP